MVYLGIVRLALRHSLVHQMRSFHTRHAIQASHPTRCDLSTGPNMTSRRRNPLMEMSFSSIICGRV